MTSTVLIVFSSCILLLAFIVPVPAIPVDNGVEGDPEIDCADSFIGINFRTRNPFEGRIFVKEKFIDPECRAGATNSREAGIKLSFTSCGVERRRSINPRGVFVGVTVIISFHPQFITKVDKAYMIQCYYMESWKTVSAELEVSMLTTDLQTQTVPMPACRYEVLSGGPNGVPVVFAQVGDQVYHKWTCDTDSVDVFCMTVHSCKVDDGAGDQIPLINELGCGLDKHILGNLEYISDLMAGREAHVFKYADRAYMYFDCQITITVKTPGLPCSRPGCAEPNRRKRSPNNATVSSNLRNKVAKTDAKDDKNDMVPRRRKPLLKKTKLLDLSYYFEDESISGMIIDNETDYYDHHVCMTLTGISVFTALNTFLILSSIVLCMASVKAVN